MFFRSSAVLSRRHAACFFLSHARKHSVSRVDSCRMLTPQKTRSSPHRTAPTFSHFPFSHFSSCLRSSHQKTTNAYHEYRVSNLILLLGNARHQLRRHTSANLSVRWHHCFFHQTMFLIQFFFPNFCLPML